MSKSKTRKVGGDGSAEPKEPPRLEGPRLEVDVLELENWRTAGDAVLKAELAGQQLEESPLLVPPGDGDSLVVDMRAAVGYDVEDAASLDKLAAHPLLFTLFEVAGRDRWQLTGACNLDLVPVLLGDDGELQTTVLLQPARDEVVSWPTLPRLRVVARRVGPAPPANNLLLLTLEAALGVPPDPSSSAAGPQAAVPLPHGRAANFGVASHARDRERYKRWATLSHVAGRGALSPYPLAKDWTVPSTGTPCDALLAGPRLQWDALWRCWLADTDAQALLDALFRHGRLPLELLFATSPVPGASSKAKQQQQQQQQATAAATRFVAYLELSTLTYPGVRRARLAGRLVSYSAQDVVQHTGVERTVLEIQSIEPSRPSEGSVRTRGGGGSRPKKTESRRSVTTATPPPATGEDAEPATAVSLVDAEGRPALVVVEVELLRPLVAARALQQLEASVTALVPELPRLPPSVASARLADQRYRDAVRKSCELLARHYREFMARRESPAADGPQLARDFSLHLLANGGHQAVTETLRGRVAALVAERRRSSSDDDSLVSDAYVELVGVAHEVVTSLAEPGAAAPPPPVALPADRLLLFALEADEEDDERRAERFHLRRVSDLGDDDPQVWVDYTVFLWGRRRPDEALQSCREARGRDARHLPAALLHALLLDEQGAGREAAVLLEALLGLLPAAPAAAWVTLHLLELAAGRRAEADVALHAAGGRDGGRRQQQVGPEPLSWDARTHEGGDGHSVFVEAAAALLRLRGHGRAAEALGRAGTASLAAAYYVAAGHYLAGDPACALVHIARAATQHGDSCLLRSLQGHCHHRLGEVEDAERCYDYVVRSADRPNDFHLVGLRLAGYWLQQGRYLDAKNLYLEVCSRRPTPRTWLGAGVASYRLDELEESERALAVACALDNMCPLTWGHLALLSLRLGRERQFQQCMRQALKHGLDPGELLATEINSLCEARGFPDPFTLG